MPAENPPMQTPEQTPELITGMPPEIAPDVPAQEPTALPELITAPGGEPQPGELSAADAVARPGMNIPIAPQDVTLAARQNALGSPEAPPLPDPKAPGGPLGQQHE